jgi:putative transcriptional regulator
MSEIDIRAGTLLVAPPALDDPNFNRAVVLLCEHTDEGSFGLVLNRPLEATPSDLVDGMDGYTGRLNLGGPVQTDTLHYLHRHGDTVTDAVGITDGVMWGGDFELIRAMIAADATSEADLRFYLGYAGWSAGQLQAELDQGGWFLTDAHPEDVFIPDSDALWRSVLRRMGGEYAILANFPDDPRMN